jgi:hypothetical protein
LSLEHNENRFSQIQDAGHTFIFSV